DLKPENFLFANKKENSPLKAIDFGLSIFFKPGTVHGNDQSLSDILNFRCDIVVSTHLVVHGERFSEIVGSPYYMAPEVLKRNYGPEIDIWSAGVILYILLCGVPPFWAGKSTFCYAESEQGVAQAILRGLIDFKHDPWPNISESAKSLVQQMLEPDPKLRLTAKQVLEHPWLQNAKKAPNVPLGDVVKSRLKQFSIMNRFKRKALRVIAEFLSVEEVEGIKEMFKKMDTDNDGIVSIEELKAVFGNVGSQLEESEVQMMLIEAYVSAKVEQLEEVGCLMILLSKNKEWMAFGDNVLTLCNYQHLETNYNDGDPESVRNATSPLVHFPEQLVNYEF
ncbi:hypothetical protein Golob_018743, partial [Gossypium lobatum]|nr:hypothetical protein [Gossypium lobatum]